MSHEEIAAHLPEALARPSAYPSDSSASAGIEWVQTHLSHVFLTHDRVYKLRKAVDLGFLDFRRRAERNADCLREVRLNRRLAPDVYLGVAPIEPTGDSYRVGVVGESIDQEALDHVVVMRRLPAGRDALSLLARGALHASHLDAVARRLARFHVEHGLGVPSPFPPETWLEAVCAPVRDTLERLAAAPGGLLRRSSVERLRARSDSFATEHRDAIEARRRAGRAVDGHGDVHLQHVWFEPGRAEPLLIDCIEFNDALRRIDGAAEIAFLAMDLRYRSRPRLAERFLRSYASERDDYDAYRLVDWFASYRAAVRALVAAQAAVDPSIGPDQREAAADSARRHLALALRLLGPRRGGALVVVAGVVGTGKSTVAGRLADAVGGVVIASDRVRKALRGLEPTDRGGAAAGLYAEGEKDAVYAALLDRAEPVLESGRVAVLDATYARERHRSAVLELASRYEVPMWILETRCDAETAIERLALRQASGRDPSDAGPALHARSGREFEPIRPVRGVEHRVLHTDAVSWRSDLRHVSAALRVAARGSRPRARPSPRGGPSRRPAGSSPSSPPASRGGG